MATSNIVAVLALIPLLPLILILCVRLLLCALGWYLQAQTTARKTALIDRVKNEQADISEKQVSREVEDGWEKIEESATAENGKPILDDWSGVVGFFHPFWYAQSLQSTP